MRLLFPIILSLVLLFNLHARAELADEKVYIKGQDCDDSKIKQNPDMLKALKILKQKLGRVPQLRSCFRNSDSQARVAKKYPGRASKKISQHIIGVASDLIIGGGDKSICDVLDSVRKSVGHGGIGTYGDGSGHLDVRPGFASWAGCGQYKTTEYQSPVVEEYLRTATMAGDADNG